MSARTKFGKNQPIYALQADIKQYFQSIDWEFLLKLIKSTVTCPQTFDLIQKIITSYQRPTLPTTQLELFNPAHHHQISQKRVGLPIGNLTSQLFANIYLNQFDHFVKDRLREKYYARYMDDFLIIHPNKKHLKKTLVKIQNFLNQNLKLKLHPKKMVIKHASKNGLPFVGYLIFYDHVKIRGNTLRRMQKNYGNKIKAYLDGKITLEKLTETESALHGHFNHASSYGLEKHLAQVKKNLLNSS